MSSVEVQREDELLDRFAQLVAQLHLLDWKRFTELADQHADNQIKVAKASSAASKQ